MLGGVSESWDREWPVGWTVEHVAETGSTNADLLLQAEGRVGSEAAVPRPHRSVLATDHQTAGRGRLDRKWDAPAGSNLLVSLLFRADAVGADAGELVRRVSLAAVDAARAVAPAAAGDALRLKWPNDLLLGGDKLAGVLAQRDGAGAVVVGIGINVGWCPPGAARLGDGVDPADLLDGLLRTYDRLPLPSDELHRRYRDELGTLGQRVRIERPGGEIIGRAVDVERDGRLVVLDECAVTHRVDIGDVTHLRPAPQ